LRDALSAGPSPLHASPAIPVGRFDRRAEPLLDQPQHVGIDNTACQRLHQLVVRDGIERRHDRLPIPKTFLPQSLSLAADILSKDTPWLSSAA
jgi:hypothetical protein